MKTAISLPDALFERAESAAARAGISRSQFYARALAEFLSRHTADEVTATLNAVIAETGQPRDEAAIRTGKRRLAESEW